jgi:hypothetical protein
MSTNTFPIGHDVAVNEYRPLPDVIGDVEKSAAGNSVLRVGTTNPDGSWTQTAHIVLAPAERDVLIDALTAQREADPILYSITRRDLDEHAGRKVTDDEADSFIETFHLTSVNECIGGWLEGAGIAPDDTDA